MSASMMSGITAIGGVGAMEVLSAQTLRSLALSADALSANFSANSSSNLSSISAPNLASNLTSSSIAANDNFGASVTQGLQQLNQQLNTSQIDLQKLALGDAQNLHQMMIRLEESQLSFQLMLQIRNRLLESYQEVMKMQV